MTLRYEDDEVTAFCDHLDQLGWCTAWQTIELETARSFPRWLDEAGWMSDGLGGHICPFHDKAAE